MNKKNLILLSIITSLSMEAKVLKQNTYYEDDKIEWERYYENDIRKNIHNHYDKKGNIDIKETYIEGKLKGVSIISHGEDVIWKNTSKI